ncbi:MAG TPA: DUF3052 domain-containing protein [Candidatus Andersenbacteria bacterium]|nr:DUF3052 domain-containing protein [Candidatus Andersenbacteria bacterium]
MAYSSTPLYKKLGIKPGSRVSVINSPNGYKSWLQLGSVNCDFVPSTTLKADIVHIFAKTQAEFASELHAAKPRIFPAGAIWVSWPKNSARSTIKSSLTENAIRDYALTHGLVDVKVASINDAWSGLKLIYRLKDR